MKFNLGNIWPFWTRDLNGENFYDVTTLGEWAENSTNFEFALNHPVLTPALLFVAKIFSQAEFITNENSNRKTNNGLLDLLNNPNEYQTREDFLETLCFMMITQGACVVALEQSVGFSSPVSMHVLNYDLIKWGEGLNKGVKKKNNALKGKIRYDPNGEDIEYKLSDLLFFYDLPNAVYKNPFKVKSRLDGLSQTLLNTKDSLIAKNIILRSNGKEMITGKKGGFPLTPEEKKDAENLFNNEYGLSFSRRRGIVTKADVSWKSMHIALRDLGLDESIRVDGNIIYTALHIPKDILSLEAKKTTYNNFKESMVSYVQNEIQPTLNSVISVFNKKFNNGENILRGNYEHLPIMQFIRLERYDVVKKQLEALQLARIVGMNDLDALTISGFDKNIKLNPMLSMQNQDNNKDEK